MKKIALLWLIISFSSDLLAQYPTIWIIENRSQRMRYVECRSHGLMGLPDKVSIKIGPVFLIHGQDFVNYFGPNWHNDGRGLNAGQFECAVSEHPHPLHKPLLSYSFFADWGENIHLVITDSAVLRSIDNLCSLK